MKVDYESTAALIADACGGKVISGDPGTAIKTITSDSRDTGSSSLFVPLVGENFDGHDFIESLVNEGRISSFLTMKEGDVPAAGNGGISGILCDDTLSALGAIAARHRASLDIKMVGITGTNGKTTTKELVFTILNNSMRCFKNEKNYNNEIGVPFTLLGLRADHEAAVIEMGMNHSGELDRLSRMTLPDISVITNVGEGHLEFLGTVENVALSKTEIMHGMKKGSILIANRDMACFDIVTEKAGKMGLKTITFGLSKNADIYPDSYRLLSDRLQVIYKENEIEAPLYGMHNVYNVIAAIAVAEQLGIAIGQVCESLPGFVNISGRSQVIDSGYIVIDDTYNSNPLSLKYALQSVSEIFPDRRKIAVLSDMKELGESSALFHSDCGKLAAEMGFDLLCAWGDLSKNYAEGALKAGMDKESVYYFEKKDDLVQHVTSIAGENDVILVKGSRSMKMEDVVNALRGKEE